MANSQEQIGIEQLGLGAVLKRYRLLVPANQRDYAWSEREVRALLEDLSFAMANDESQHFFGTLVTIPRENGVLEVVDGQQRLATTALTLAAMSQIAKTSAGNLSRALEAFLSDVDNQTLEMAPKLNLNSADTAVFHALVTGGDASQIIQSNRDSHRLLNEAYETTRAHMVKISSTVSEANRTKIFQNWMNYIEYSAKVILLIVPNTSNAYKMFETLNDRGLRVSQSDLVKNHIFGEAKGRLSEAQATWSFIKGTLETLDEEDTTVNFLWQALISMQGPIRQAEVYEKVQAIAKGVQTSIAFLNDLEHLAGDYVALSNPSSDKWNSYPSNARRLLSVLNFFDIKPFRPLLMAIARKIEPKEAVKSFEKLVSLGVRLIIASSTRSGSIEQQCGKAAKAVSDGEITSANAIHDSLKGIIPNDEQFRAAFEVATVSQAKFARYYLRSIEMAAKNEPDPWLLPNDDPDAINLEHVLPRKPMADWPQFSEDDVRTYSRRIGNMALLKAKANSAIASSNFEIKKSAFIGSPYTTTNMIASQQNWTVSQIVERQKHLAELALKAWPLRT
jgi:Protein of unknown function DUF262/Protein of unknown function (DUF1524)